MIQAVLIVVAAHKAFGSFLLKGLCSGPTSEDRAPAGEADAWGGCIEDFLDVFYSSYDHAPLEIRNVPECEALASLFLDVMGGV